MGRLFYYPGFAERAEPVTSLKLSFFVYAAVPDLQTLQKPAQNLIVAAHVMPVIVFTKKCAELMLAQTKIGKLKKFKDIVVPQIQGNFQFSENKIVVQPFLRLRRLTFFLAAHVVDKTVQKDGELSVIAWLEGRIVIFFQPVAHLRPRHFIACRAEHGHHPRIIHVKNIADTSQYIVIIQPVLLSAQQQRIIGQFLAL